MEDMTTPSCRPWIRSALAAALAATALASLGCRPPLDGDTGMPDLTTATAPAIQPASVPPRVPDKIATLAAEDQSQLLRRGLANYKANVRSYTCVFIKQERIRGKLGEIQHTQVKYKEDPFSVVMTWTKNSPPGDRTIYVKGKYDDRMLVRPKGLDWLVGTIARAPDAPDVLANTLRPITNFGFRRTLESLLEVCERADRAGDVTSSYGGKGEVAGVPTVILIRELPDGKDYPAAKTIVHLAADRLLPVRLETYDWDGQLLALYEYRNINFDAKLGDADFTPQANGMKPPK